VPRLGAIQHVLHEPSPHASILQAGIDRDRADSGNDGTLVQEVAADDSAIKLRHHLVEPRVREQT
jgi:hypothetical protein